MSSVPEETVTIFEDYYKDDNGVWYRWKLPNDEKWHVKLTGLSELPYVRYKVLSQEEFRQLEQVTDMRLDDPNTTTEADTSPEGSRLTSKGETE